MIPGGMLNRLLLHCGAVVKHRTQRSLFSDGRTLSQGALIQSIMDDTSGLDERVTWMITSSSSLGVSNRFATLTYWNFRL